MQPGRGGGNWKFSPALCGLEKRQASRRAGCKSPRGRVEAARGEALHAGGAKLHRREIPIAPRGVLLPGRCCDGAGQGQETLNRLGTGQGGSQQAQQRLELGAVRLPAALLLAIPFSE